MKDIITKIDNKIKQCENDIRKLEESKKELQSYCKHSFYESGRSHIHIVNKCTDCGKTKIERL